jgi:hypothetical protein
MNKIFASEFFWKILIEVVLIGLLVFYVQKHFENKWAPLTAGETLKKENFLNAKRDVYFEAINILNRHLAYTHFTVNGQALDTFIRVLGGNYPNELEVNACFSKLCIYSDNRDIPLTFASFFVPQTGVFHPVINMSLFISLIRRDMGYGTAMIDTTGDNYKYILIPEQK